MAIRFFDMFAGIGGFRSGLEAVGDFECIGHCEIDKYANKAYHALYEPKGEIYYEDATKINPAEVPDIDLICAGFPCQSFSVAGKRLGFADTRGTLFFEVARIAGEKRPAFLLLENVPGLLSHDGGRTFETILSALVEMGYHPEWCVLNSKYFGVPQQRRRLYIVGHRDGRGAGEVFPLGSGNAENLKQIVPGPQGSRVYSTDGVACTQCAGSGGWGGKTGLYFIDLNPEPAITDEARCLIARYDSGVGNHKGRNSGVLVEDTPRAILTPDRETIRQNGRRMKEPDEPMFTITAQDRHGIVHHGRIRKLMPMECWRLQGFTDEQFQKAQAIGLSDGHLYKMAGNAVICAIGFRSLTPFFDREQYAQTIADWLIEDGTQSTLSGSWLVYYGAIRNQFGVNLETDEELRNMVSRHLYDSSDTVADFCMDTDKVHLDFFFAYCPCANQNETENEDMEQTMS